MRKIENRISTEIPPAVTLALQHVWVRNLAFKHIFHCVELPDGAWAGVAGDGENGWYEYFIWRDGKVNFSNVGYGLMELALRAALNLALGDAK